MKVLLRKMAIWAAMALFLLFASSSPTGGGTVPVIDAQKTVVLVWMPVDVVTIAGIVKISCSFAGLRHAESICITSSREIFVESGKNGATYVISKGEVLARGPNLETASRLAAEKINRILRIGQMLGKNPPTAREFLPPKTVPTRRILP